MLTVTPIRGNNGYAAAHYFSAADDYYTKEHPGMWQGQGAAMLGLEGGVEQKQFARLLDGRLPDGSRIANSFDKENNKKRMGLDLTFSPPKSVSLQALVAGDHKIMEAHDNAVTKALHEIELLAEARKKVKGKSFRERTGNMVIGKFRHEMSRAKDPQLHTHAVVLNMTRREDGQWRALSNEDIFRVQHEIDAIYMNTLAQELQAQGYQLRIAEGHGNFELAHISREQIEIFSARGKVIENALAQEGKTRATATALEKQVIALATRPRKDEKDREAIKKYWLERSGVAGIDYAVEKNNAGMAHDSGVQLLKKDTPIQAVLRYAINHLTERESVVRESDLAAAAMYRAVGLTSADEVRAEIRRLTAQGTLIEAAPAYQLADKKTGQTLSADGWKRWLQDTKGMSAVDAKKYVANAIRERSLVAVERRYTTQKALKREKAILAIERSGRGKMRPLFSVDEVNRLLVDTKMNEGQCNAVRHMLCTENRFVGIQGDAGTGKTYAVKQAVDFIEQANAGREHKRRVIALAPYGNQVKALKNEGLDAHTLASFLGTRERAIDENTVIMLDEAAVVGARQMEQVMRIIEKADARLFHLGDTKQTESIEASRPYAQLQEAGMPTVRLQEIKRQQNPELKSAVWEAANSRMAPSLAHVRHVAEHVSPLERHRAIVSDYINLPESDRRDTLIVSGTNAARRSINTMVRESTGLNGKGHEYDMLTRVDMTQAQRRFAPAYRSGMIIQPEKDYPKSGLARGELYTVRDVADGNMLVVEKQDGSRVEVNPRRITQLSVYQQERGELSVGDTVRINRNEPALDLTNGDRMRVASVSGATIRLESVEEKNGHPKHVVELAGKKPLHVEYAYASTVHSAQGLTSGRVMIDMDTKSRTTSMNLYYVALSRARHEARIYTSSAKELPAAISRQFKKTDALSVQRGRELQRGRGNQLAKGNMADRRQHMQQSRTLQSNSGLAGGREIGER